MSAQLAGQDFQVQSVPKHKPGKGEILVRNHAIATNPMDWMVQKLGVFVQNWNVIVGTDIAGTIEEVGEDVTKWRPGDKVYGICFETPFGTRKGAFQEYTITEASYVSQIPNNFSFEEAAAFVLPLLTAASSFYINAKLPHPSPKRPTITKDSEVFFVNSGSSGVGSAAVQLAVLVIATASAHNFELVKSLGASEVFDYKDPDLVRKVKNSAGKKIDYAFDAACNSASTAYCVEILEEKGNLLTVSPRPLTVDKKEVNVFTVFGSQILDNDSEWWWDFAKAAAEEGSLVPLKPEVLGTSLEDVNKVVAFHALGKVSGVKPIVKLI